MKTLPKNGVFLIVSCITVSLFSIHHTSARPGGRISFETFYYELAPFGSWVQDVDYGYVWVPDVPGDFQPYATDGHWVMTEYGNTWVSDYSWGWAPFHYGRWRFDDYYGWMWIPGTEWGPAWVAWRSGGGYYGWAPLVPGLNISISVNIGRYIPNNYWVFVRQGYITRPHIYRYCVPRRNVVRIVNHTTIIHNTYVYNNRSTYYTGPKVRDIERATRRPVRVHRIQQTGRPGTTVVRNGAVSVYRPSVRDDRRDFVPTRGREAAADNNSRSGRSYSSERPRTSSDMYHRRSSGESRSVDERRSTRSDRSNSNRNNTPAETRARESNSNRTRVATPNRSNTRESTSNRVRESAPARGAVKKSTPARSRESYSGRSNHRESNINRSRNAVRSNNKTTPSRGSSQVRGQQQRQQPAVRSSRSSRQSSGQRQSQTNTRSRQSSRSDNRR